MPWHCHRFNTESFCLLDDEQFDSLSDKQRVEYLAHAIDALEKLNLQILRLLSGAAYSPSSSRRRVRPTQLARRFRCSG